ncbi:MAG TPA: alpha/beta fold hydrolase [Pirellulales bacterium]|nr:alpha/beta fold hydrolase [Pirellulales bacterium]
MSDKDLGKALLKLDVTPPETAAHVHFNRIVEDDHRRMQWLARLAVTLWILAAVEVLSIAVSGGLVFPAFAKALNERGQEEAAAEAHFPILEKLTEACTVIGSLLFVVLVAVGLVTVVLIYRPRRAHIALREHWREMLDRCNWGFHKCTPRAHAALAYAGQEAVRLGSPQCGDEHILLGLLREGGGVAAIVLQRLGIETDRVESAIERHHKTRPECFAQDGRRTEVLAAARANAVGLGHAFVGTEHVLLGMLVNPQPTLETVLENLGSYCDQVRQETLAVLTQAPTPKPMNGQQGGAPMAPAFKAMMLVATLFLLLMASWLPVRVSGEDNTAQGLGEPSEQSQESVTESRKTGEGSKYRIEDVQIPLKADRALAGTMVVPIASHRVPAMLVIPGYGRNDGGAPPHADALEEAGIQFRRFLAERGIAVLRVPFGTGPRGDDPDLSLNELADRALQCVGYLKGRSEIDPERIGVFGHSAGGAVAILAASRSSDLAFLVAAASPVEPVESTALRILDGVLRNGGATEADRTAARDVQQGIFDRLAKGAKPDELRPDLQKLIRMVYARFPKDHPALAGKDPEVEIQNAAERQLRTLTSPWFRGLLGFDPAAALARTQCPALILFAERDPKIDPRKNSEIAKAVLEVPGKKGSSVQVIPKADHSFEVETASATPRDQQAHQRLSPEFLEVLSSWLVERDGRGPPTPSPASKP